MTILLLGCGGNAGINFVKSIKMSDPTIKVIGLDKNIYNIQLSNCDVKLLRSYDSISDKIKDIKEICSTYGVKFIHAQPDPEVKFLVENACHFDNLILRTSIDDLELCSNKLEFQRIVSNKLGVAYKSYNCQDVIKSPKLFDEILGNNKSVWFRSIRGAGSKAALPISNFTMLKAWADYWNEKASTNYDDYQVAEILPGSEYAIQTFWINGELYHSQARQRLVYFFGNLMPSGQSSTPAVAKTISDDEVYDVAHKTVLAVNPKPHGIYCIDMKRNQANVIIPTEINYGRFFTTSDFFSTLGINTPYELYLYVTKQCLPVKRINTSAPDILWIRGLDTNPKMIK